MAMVPTMTTTMTMDATTSSTNNHLVPNKEAVAALSATLAFRRFDDHQQHATHHHGDKNNNGGSEYHKETSSPLSLSHDPMADDNLRRLSSILSLGGDGKGMRRASLDTILSSRGGSLRSSRSSGGGAESLNNNKHSSVDTDVATAAASCSAELYIDDISLNSDDLQNDEDEEEEGSMTISLLEDKKLSSNNYYSHYLDHDNGIASNSSSDDEMSCNTSCNNESIDFLKEEEEDHAPNHHPNKGKQSSSSSARGFVSSLQKIFDSSHNRSNKSSNASSSYSSFSKSQSSSKQHQNNPDISSSTWKKRFKSSSSSSNNNNSLSSQRISSKNNVTSSSINNNTSSWKDNSSNLSGCLKHPHDSTTSGFQNPTPYSPKPIGKRARVSWRIDDNDGELNFAATANSKPHANASSDESHGNNNTRHHLANSLMSEDAGSIDLEAMMATTARSDSSKRDNSGSLAASSLHADEQLLASMIQLAHQLSSNSCTSSSWGNYHDVSASSGLSSHSNNNNGQQHPTTAAAAAAGNDVGRKSTMVGISLSPNEATNEIVAKGETASASLERCEQDTTKAMAGQQQEDICSRLDQSSPPTVATVTRLAYQEVEDYRTRLQKKRASMMEDENSDAAAKKNTTREETQELNELLLENATNISNALLLQRALYTLRIHNNNSNNHPRGDGINTAAESNALNAEGTIPRRAHSEHTGIDRMALNHFLTLSSSATNSAPSNNNNFSATTNSSQSNNDWNTPSSNSNNNPFSAITSRRNTYQEGQGESNRTSSAPPPQIGAHQSNEPAPLLFRRTFTSTAPNRREARVEARRHTLQTLARERSRSSSEAAVSSNSSSDRSRVLVNDVNFNDSSDCSTGGTHHRIRHSNSLNYNNNNDDTTITPSSSVATSGDTRDADSYNGSPNSGRNNGLVASCRSAMSSPHPQNLAPSSIMMTTTGEEADHDNYQNDDSTYHHDYNNNPTVSHHQSLRDLLRASVRHQSFRNSKRLLHAILVSDEIVEADHVETIFHNDNDTATLNNALPRYGDAENLVPSLQERLVMMEDLLGEQDEEQRHVLGRYRRREKILVVLMVLSVMIIIVLIIVMVVNASS